MTMSDAAVYITPRFFSVVVSKCRHLTMPSAPLLLGIHASSVAKSAIRALLRLLTLAFTNNHNEKDLSRLYIRLHPPSAYYNLKNKINKIIKIKFNKF